MQLFVAILGFALMYGFTFALLYGLLSSVFFGFGNWNILNIIVLSMGVLVPPMIYCLAIFKSLKRRGSISDSTIYLTAAMLYALLVWLTGQYVI
ncbi:MAG: hypothetical protein K0Q66_2422 [Chitinophagaceae bacterium]|nr:hypothetical protein [Chitinophagaceae bacterium]